MKEIQPGNKLLLTPPPPSVKRALSSTFSSKVGILIQVSKLKNYSAKPHTPLPKPARPKSGFLNYLKKVNQLKKHYSNVSR